jgi:sugar transferase (PEP-CTERM/EpsH1 system associated)
LKILIITPRIPYPPFRGDKLKIYNLSKHLSQKNSVKIITFLRNKEQLKDLENFKKTGIQIETVRLPILESLFKTLLALFSQIPFQVAWFSSEKMKRKIKEEISKNNYDVVYFHLIRSAQYLESATGQSLNVLDFTDAVSLYLNRFAEIEKNYLKKFFIKIEEKRIKYYETIAEKFQMVFICSEIDKEYLQNRGINANIKIINNGIDIDYFSSDNEGFEKDRIIFTGNMPYYANYDAAIYFAKEIFPLILEKRPTSKFYIVGQKPPNKIKAIASDNIVVTGFVPDIKKEYLKSAVNIAPMRFGAGTLNKVIESIALGIPVVSTTIAVEGLPEELKKYIFVADNSLEFSQQVLLILNNPKLRENMKEGQVIIKKILSWEKIVSKFENDLKEELLKFY